MPQCGTTTVSPGVKLMFDSMCWPFQHGIVIERKLELPAVFVVKDVELFALGPIGQSARFRERLQHGHAIGVRNGPPTSGAPMHRALAIIVQLARSSIRRSTSSPTHS
jgi:hypothetical protein